MNIFLSSILGGLTTVGIALIAMRYGNPIEVFNFYWSVKSEIFGGLFTIAGLLLSVKTYIILKLEEGIYSKTSYKKDFIDAKALRKIKYDCHLQPLKNFSNALANAIAIPAGAAICQLAAAAAGAFEGILLGFGTAGAACGSLIFCWFRIKANLDVYFHHLREESAEEMKTLAKQREEDLRSAPEFKADDNDH